MSELANIKITLKYKLDHDLVIVFPETIKDAVNRMNALRKQGVDYEVKYKVLK